MQDAEITNGNTLADEVEINLNMLRALMLNRVGGHVDRADVVAVDKGSTARRTVELMKKLSEPRSLSNTIGDGAVLGLSAGAGHGVLTLRGPGDQVVTKEHSIARGGLPRVGTTSPISIRVDNQIRLRTRAQNQTKVQGAADVAQDALESSDTMKEDVNTWNNGLD